MGNLLKWVDTRYEFDKSRVAKDPENSPVTQAGVTDTPEIKWGSVVFIGDTGEIWSHGTFMGGKTGNHDTVFENNVIPVLQKYYSEYELVFLSDNEFDITKTVFGKYGKLVNYTNSEEITTIIAESSFVITNKLHVGLIATLAGVSVISFPFFYEKVHRFYDDINELDRCVQIENITPELVKEKLDTYFNKPIILSQDYIEASKENFKYLSQIKPNTNTINITLKDLFNVVVNDIGKHWVFNLYYETEIRNLCNNKK